jgi:hypothetical protein
MAPKRRNPKIARRKEAIFGHEEAMDKGKSFIDIITALSREHRWTIPTLAEPPPFIPCQRHILDDLALLMFITEYPPILMSLLVPKAENECAFSVRTFDVDDRAGRTTNDLITTRVRARMEVARIDKC